MRNGVESSTVAREREGKGQEGSILDGHEEREEPEGNRSLAGDLYEEKAINQIK